MQIQKTEKTKWQLKRKELMQSDTYRRIINHIEGDAAMMHRINLAVLVEKTNPGEKFHQLEIGSKSRVYRPLGSIVGSILRKLAILS